MPHPSKIKRISAYLGDRAKLNESYKAVFGTVHGDIVLRHLMKVGYMFQPTYVQGDPTESAHREGMRRFVLSITRQLKMTDEEVLEIMEQDYG